LYHLKYASKQWNKKVISFLRDIHFKQSSAENSLFIRNTKLPFIALLVYLDHIILY